MNEQKEQYIFVQGKNDFCIIETALIPKHPISCLMDSASSYQLIGTYYKGNLGRVQTPTGNLVKIDDKYYKSIVGDARTIITEDGRIFCNDLDEEYMNRLRVSIKDIFETLKSQKENSK